MLKYSDEELAGKRGYDLIHPDDCHYYSAAHQERTSWYHHILVHRHIDTVTEKALIALLPGPTDFLTAKGPSF